MPDLTGTAKLVRLFEKDLPIFAAVAFPLFVIIWISSNSPIVVYSLDESGKNATKIELHTISSVISNSTFFVKGTLVDLGTGKGIENAAIKFSGNGSISLSEVKTGGVIFDDPDGVQVLHFAPGGLDCPAQVIVCGAGDPGIDALRLGKNGTISFSQPPNGVALKIQGMKTDTFFVEVTIANPVNVSSSFYAESFGANNEVSYLNLATLGGIEMIRVVNITDASDNPDDGFVSLTGLTVFDPAVDPALEYQLNFTNVQKQTYNQPLKLHVGFFASIGNTPAAGNVAEVVATFEGDENHNGTSANVYYDIIPSIFESGIFVDGEIQPEEEPSEEDSEAGQQGETASLNPTSYSGTEYTSIDCATGDTDSDGLCNSWEGPLGGIVYGSGANQATYQLKIAADPYRNWLPKYSDPNKPDVYLEIDYMEYHRPDDVAIQKVIDAFDAAPGGGIELYVVVDEEFAHTAASNYFKIWKDSSPSSNDDFLTVKRKKLTWPTTADLGFGTDAERNFDTGRGDTYHKNYLNAKAQAYHYGLFVHSILGTCGPSGHAERPGNDLVVALGCGFAGSVGGHSGSIGSIDEQAGTLMHELGHNLNLRHGGNVDMNCKANYQSIMTYSRQMPYYFDQGHPWILDYSRIDHPNQVETSLSEDSPLSYMPERYVIWAKPGASPRHMTATIDSGSDVDWMRTGNPPVQSGVSVDLNDFAIKGCGKDANGNANPVPNETELGYDDWGSLDFNFRPTAGTGFDGMSGPVNELDAEVRFQIVNQTTNVIVDSFNTKMAVANKDNLQVSGSTNNAAGKGYEVHLSWGDGSISKDIEIRNDGTWGPVNHVYGSLAAFSNPHPVVAELVHSATDKSQISTSAFSVIVISDKPPEMWFWIAMVLLAIVIILVIYIVWFRTRPAEKHDFVVMGTGKGSDKGNETH
jgi:hypothetical protein